MGQVLGSLSPVWEIWIEFLVPSFGLTRFRLQLAFGE